MPLPTITDGYYCAYRFKLFGVQSAEVTFSVTAPSTTAADVGADIISAWAGSIKNAQVETCTLVSASVTALDGTAAAVIVPSGVDGTNTNDGVTDSLAVISTLRTGIAGRSNRGRIYWPGLGTDMLSVNGYTIDPTFKTGFQSAVDDWHDAMTGTGETLGVLSRKLSSFREVTALEVRDVIGTQRRRLTGGLLF
jgi:hypothetical protein